MLMSNNPDFIVFLKKNNIEEIQPNDYDSEKIFIKNLTNTYGDFFFFYNKDNFISNNDSLKKQKRCTYIWKIENLEISL